MVTAYDTALDGWATRTAEGIEINFLFNGAFDCAASSS